MTHTLLTADGTSGPRPVDGAGTAGSGAAGWHAPDERAARGRAARADAPRSAHAAWEPPADRADPVDLLEEQSRGRVPELVPLRYGRMLVSPFTFYRGAAAIMASDLAATPRSGLRAQLCGDAHLSNFGGFGSPDRDLVFDINDFDETLPGPWEWDVKRLAASFSVAGRALGLAAEERRVIASHTVRSYRAAMRTFAAQTNLEVWYARLDVAEMARRWSADLKESGRKRFKRTVAKARTKDSMRALSKLTQVVDGEPRIVSDPPIVVPIEDLSRGDAEWAQEVVGTAYQGYHESLDRDRRHLLDGYRPVHWARKVVGVGSVGTRAWIVLLLGRDDQDPLFLQFKEADRSVLAPYAGRSVFGNAGRRVVEGQRLLQAAGDIFLGWTRVTVDGRTLDFYGRQLWDWKASADVEAMTASGLEAYGQACGWTLARAHARSGDRIAIAHYLGSGTNFDEAIAAFSERYADQNERDHEAFTRAVEAGRLPVDHDG